MVVRSVQAIFLSVLLSIGDVSWGADSRVKLQPLFPGKHFSAPVALIQRPDGNWYLVEQTGVVQLLDSAGNSQVALDITNRVRYGGERGLLDLALHPEFQRNGRVFLSYTTERGGQLVSVISELNSLDQGRGLDRASEREILTVGQPYGNHNGGHIAFGPDGYLYIGLGDGGSAGDPQGNGQNRLTLLGALLRLDVDTKAGKPYVIPSDNPFIRGGGRPELFAWGLRNPWRWSFDALTGDLWLADVGQDDWEEVNLIRKGGNYGWNIREGAHCYKGENCRQEDLIPPVAEYSHDLGCSVTGGFVYRGKAIPDLKGLYLYGDFCSGRIWGVRVGEAAQLLLASGKRISSFAQDRDNELYVLDYGKGEVFRITTR